MEAPLPTPESIVNGTNPTEVHSQMDQWISKKQRPGKRLPSPSGVEDSVGPETPQNKTKAGNLAVGQT